MTVLLSGLHDTGDCCLMAGLSQAPAGCAEPIDQYAQLVYRAVPGTKHHKKSAAQDAANVLANRPECFQGLPASCSTIWEAYGKHAFLATPAGGRDKSHQKQHAAAAEHLRMETPACFAVAASGPVSQGVPGGHLELPGSNLAPTQPYQGILSRLLPESMSSQEVPWESILMSVGAVAALGAVAYWALKPTPKKRRSR